MTQEQVIAAVERFYGAVTQRGGRADLRDATRGLLEALTAAAQEQVTGAALLLLQRLDDHERRLGGVERQAETADRLAAGASLRATEVARISDARIDQLRAEQLDPERIVELLSVVYGLGGRLPALEQSISDHEQRITAIEQRHVG
jgi:hypothetical protein